MRKTVAGNPDEIQDAQPCEGRFTLYVFGITFAWLFLTIMIGVLEIVHGRSGGWLWIILSAWGICVSSGLITQYV